MEKNVTKTWRNYPFTHAPHKSRSYDVWFLRYKVQRTKFFAILSHFLPFDPLNNPKSQNFEETKKKDWRYYDFILVCYKWQSYDVWLLRYLVQPTELFVILGYFLPFYPHNSPKKWKFQKNEKKNHLEISSFYQSVPKPSWKN